MSKDIDFLSFAKNVGDKYGKKLMDTVTNTGIDAAQIVPKRVAHKTSEATRDLTGNMEYQKITNLFGNIPDDVPKYITKKMDKSL